MVVNTSTHRFTSTCALAATIFLALASIFPTRVVADNFHPVSHFINEKNWMNEPNSML
jgi:sucrose-6-phosphate hydrolase SacC (GH32 family)